MTYEKLMADIGDRLRDWHFDHPNAPTALYLGQAQKAVFNGSAVTFVMGLTIHLTDDADYVALG